MRAIPFDHGNNTHIKIVQLGYWMRFVSFMSHCPRRTSEGSRLCTEVYVLLSQISVLLLKSLHTQRHVAKPPDACAGAGRRCIAIDFGVRCEPGVTYGLHSKIRFVEGVERRFISGVLWWIQYRTLHKYFSVVFSVVRVSISAHSGSSRIFVKYFRKWGGSLKL